MVTKDVTLTTADEVVEKVDSSQVSAESSSIGCLEEDEIALVVQKEEVGDTNKLFCCIVVGKGREIIVKPAMHIVQGCQCVQC